MDVGETLDVGDAARWRAWLEQNHSSAAEIWLVYHAKASGKASIAYGDAVDEALCFGWIDSIVKKLGPDSRAQRFTPRRPGSPVSEANKVRIRRLVASGRMTPAGLTVSGDVVNEPFAVPVDILKALQEDQETWRNFLAFPESYRRIRVGFIDGSRNRPRVFEQRLQYFLRMTKRNKRYGILQ